MNKYFTVGLAAVAALCLFAPTTQAGKIETVRVANPGNDPDTRYATPGYGRVDYLYNIGLYEVTAGQYTEFLNAVAEDDTYGLYNESMWTSKYGCKIQRAGSPGSYSYRLAYGWANRPVNYVSWGDAARFVNWLHNSQPHDAQGLATTEDGAYYLNGATSDAELLAVSREPDWEWAIPTEDEWYKAAYHRNDGATANYFDYPTGSNGVPSHHLVDPDPGNNATFTVDAQYTIGDPYYRTEVGAHENSESPYGTFDQGGNLREWTEAIGLGSAPGVRGGAFLSDNDIDLRASYRPHRGPTKEMYIVGFRVASIPEPGTLVLLMSGSLALVLLRLRKRRAG